MYNRINWMTEIFEPVSITWNHALNPTVASNRGRFLISPLMSRRKRPAYPSTLTGSFLRLLDGGWTALTWMESITNRSWAACWTEVNQSDQRINHLFQWDVQVSQFAKGPVSDQRHAFPSFTKDDILDASRWISPARAQSHETCTEIICKLDWNTMRTIFYAMANLLPRISEEAPFPVSGLLSFSSDWLFLRRHLFHHPVYLIERLNTRPETTKREAAWTQRCWHSCGISCFHVNKGSHLWLELWSLYWGWRMRTRPQPLSFLRQFFHVALKIS